MELDLKRRGWVFKELRDQEGKTLEIIHDSLLSAALPTFDLSAHPVGFTFTIYPEPGLLSPSPSLPPQTKPPSALTWIIATAS